MKLAVGIITWQDGVDNIDAAFESCADAQPDVRLLCDGVIAGVDAGDLADTTPGLADEKTAHPALPWSYECASRRWSSQSAKRTWLLDKAREHDCDWLLQIDADERLHNAHLLRPFLDGWPADAFPVPFEVDPGVMLGATWKCLRVDAWRQVVSGGAYIEHVNGTVYCVTPPGNIAPGVERFDNLESYRRIAPWLSHHPDLRPEGRKQIRLGEVEHVLEPPPHVEGYLTPSLHARPVVYVAPVSDTAAQDTTTDAAPAAEWACPQCGARYSTPGLCEQGHAAESVVAVGDVAPSMTDGEQHGGSDATGTASNSGSGTTVYVAPVTPPADLPAAAADASVELPPATQPPSDASPAEPQPAEPAAAPTWHDDAQAALDRYDVAHGDAAAALDALNAAAADLRAAINQAG